MPAPSRHAGTAAAIALLVTSPGAFADTAHVAQPWRADAVVMGRDESYDRERFLHELTFRHRDHAPSATGEGLRGTAGSVSSDRLYYDFRFLRDFAFRDGRNGALLDIQRSEDLDGAYDRQWVGLRQNLGRTELWLQGDVFADKAEVDIAFSARHHLADNSWLHASWILPDAYFNEKTDSPDTVDERPQTFFLQFHHQHASRDEHTTVSLSLSPESRFISRQEGLSVENDGLRAAITHRQRAGDWQLEFHLEGERTRRYYQLWSEDGGPSDFERDYLKALTSVTLTRHSLRPSVGLSYMFLDESGYFGRELDDTGDIRRREPTLFGGITVPLSRHASVSPGLYLSAPDIRQSFERHEDLRHTGFLGKLVLPIDIRLSASDAAVLTINPTFYLHTAGFGGGNLQLHWPL